MPVITTMMYVRCATNGGIPSTEQDGQRRKANQRDRRIAEGKPAIVQANRYQRRRVRLRGGGPAPLISRSLAHQ